MPGYSGRVTVGWVRSLCRVCPGIASSNTRVCQVMPVMSVSRYSGTSGMPDASLKNTTYPVRRGGRPFTYTIRVSRVSTGIASPNAQACRASSGIERPKYPVISGIPRYETSRHPGTSGMPGYQIPKSPGMRGYHTLQIHVPDISPTPATLGKQHVV